MILFLQDLEEQKRTKYKINGTATTAIEKSNPNLPAKSRLPYSYQEHEQGGQEDDTRTVRAERRERSGTENGRQMRD